ncbi:DoxX family protein [Abyssalbus ytuae]|uniref:DoxX family protein n=1 Tax=Abyssalbus ytuae TaxID=2926907 RepID=A0A9E6ZWU3_9FLAO|nr:DoxX family protein [Abyssalbus ytuae]UOB18256.1 DoxX family protein [Abyssalbus ytuae]
MNKKRYYIERFAAIIAAVILLQTLYFKFTGHPDSVSIFTKMGVEPYGRIALGVLELITAGLLLLPKTSYLGAVLSLGIMSGAIFSHFLILGIQVNNDGGTLFILAVIVFIFSLIVIKTRNNYSETSK